MKYYALWYYSYCDGARGAFAISEHPEMLIQLHKENSKNPESQWYNYDEKLYEMKVEPIECYTYNAETNKIEPYDGRQKENGYDFYAFNTLCNDSFGIKRVEPLCGSERFLDSLSRIPEGNPTTNE